MVLINEFSNYILFSFPSTSKRLAWLFNYKWSFNYFNDTELIHVHWQQYQLRIPCSKPFKKTVFNLAESQTLLKIALSNVNCL
jgi:hypothetical protein